MGIKGAYQARGADWYDLSAALPLLSADSNEARELEGEEVVVVAGAAAEEAELAEEDQLE